MPASGQSRRFGLLSITSALPRTPDVSRFGRHFAFVPCVDGSGLARAFFTFAGLVGAAMCSACRCGSHDRWP